jgi:hypothetical protein
MHDGIRTGYEAPRESHAHGMARSAQGNIYGDSEHRRLEPLLNDTQFITADEDTLENMISQESSSGTQARVIADTSTLRPSPPMPHEAPARPRPYKEMSLPSYDGYHQDVSPVEDFIEQVELCINYNGWDVHQAALRVLGTLSGLARSCLHGHIRPKDAEWESVRVLLLQRFCPKEEADSFLRAFNERQRLDNEPIDDFASNLSLLIRRVHPGLPDDAKERLLVHQFVTGLRDGCAFIVAHEHHEKLQSAVSSAKSLLSITKSPYANQLIKPAPPQTPFAFQVPPATPPRSETTAWLRRSPPPSYGSIRPARKYNPNIKSDG